MKRGMLGAAAKPDEAQPRPLINRSFALLWSGQLVSTLGDSLFDTTLVLWAAVQAGEGEAAPLVVSGLLVAATLPSLLVRPFAGALVDRWDKRRTLLVMDAARAVIVGMCVLLAAQPSGVGRRALTYGAVLLLSLCAQFFNPGLFALIGRVVPERDQPRATGLSESVYHLAALVGPPLAGPLLFGLGLQAALAFNEASFMVSFACVWRAASPTDEQVTDPGREVARHSPSGLLHEVAAGGRFVLGSGVLRTLAAALAVGVFGVGALRTLDIFFVTRTLHAPPALYGLLAAAFGLGSLAGAVLGPLITRWLGLSRTFAFAVLAVGLLMLVFSRMTSFAPALAVFFLLGVPNAISNVALWPLVVRETPLRLLGRVHSVLVPVWTGAGVVSTALSGYLLSTTLREFSWQALGLRFGPVDTALSGTGLLILVAGALAMLALPHEGRATTQALTRRRAD